MINIECYDHIVLSIISGRLTLEETEKMMDTIAIYQQSNDELYLMIIPVHLEGFPTKLSDMVKANKVLGDIKDRVKRIYGIKYNPIISFMTTIIVQVLRLKNNTIEAANIDDLYRIIEKESGLFPTLKKSWDHHGDTIKAKLAEAEMAVSQVS